MNKLASLFWLLSFTFLIFAHHAIAGVMELSTSYSVRNSSIDDDNFTKNESWTGSLAWYFFEQSAIELSYTNGRAKQSLKSTTDTAPLLYHAEFEMFGADLVVTLAKKGAFLQPFVRGGVARLKKEMYREDSDGNRLRYGEPIDRTVPSYGAGLKIMLTDTFSIRGSYDRWKSGSQDDKDIWDDAIKAGVSWFF